MPAKPKLVDQTPDTANEQYFDATLRHQVQVRRTASGIVVGLLLLYERYDREMSRLLREKLPSITSLGSKKAVQLFQDITKRRNQLNREAETFIENSMKEIGNIEIAAEVSLLLASLGFSGLTIESAKGGIVDLVRQPFSTGAETALTLKQWMRSVKSRDLDLVVGTIQQGLQQGLNTNKIVANVIGTRSKGFGDGVTAITRRNAEIVTRTAINHIVNSSREQVWLENQDIILGLKWTSVLDGRTSAICRSRDGKFSPVGNKPLPSGVELLFPPEARPPAHPNCRSIMTAIFDADDIAGALPNSITVGNRDVNFREQAIRRAGDRWDSMSLAQRRRAILDQKSIFTQGMVGGIPEEVTYGQWLKRQPASVQDEILGKTKGTLFRKGGLTVDKFVDRSGNELTLEELAQSEPTAFIKAGLDRDTFL